MSLKDFSFKQLDKAAQLVVGVEKKFDKENLPFAKNTCNHTRGCTSYRK